MSTASYRRRTVGVVAALIMAACGPLTVSSVAQAQVQAEAVAQKSQPVSQAPASAAAAPAAAKGKHSVVTWGASADRQSAGPADRSYRLIVRTSVGGTNMQIRLSNAFGENPVTFASTYAGLQKQGAELVRGSNRQLSFGGAASVTVPAGETVLSDPLPGKLAAQSNLVVSLYVTGAQGPTTGHGMAMQTSYATAGDHAAEEGAAAWTDPMGSWYWLDAVNVETSTSIGSVVTLGDSITDGWQSSTDLNRRWPDYLSRRLQAADTPVKGVANEGISGNKVLADGAGQSALNRLQRDVLSHPGVRTVFLFEGVNDIKAHSGVTAQDMIDGYRKIIDQAHAAGKCVVGSTIAPFKGWYEWDTAAESVRLEINEFVRNSGELDAVTDFDKILRSPYDHERISPFFDNGDHLHPNDVGMGAMADAVDIGSLTSC
ncbi:SGNH/GDSL hydrolase family protein [Streptomyces sp. NBC_00658]|uniref:SGNH/GDSL hydrolase family protein n=1 Tax=Streptomyces sp. NBC_00658 TaxID=2975800 RepID=UPI003250D3E3